MYGFVTLVVTLGLSVCFGERHSRGGLMNFFQKSYIQAILYTCWP